MKITERDIKILEFLKEVNVADTKTLSILFFNGSIRRCNQRMKILKDNKKVKYFRENILSPNIYYIGRKPANWKHKIVFSQLLGMLQLNNIKILKYRTPFICGSVIADGFIAININGVNKIYFVEVERTKKLDIDKYLDLYYSRKWKDFFPVIPSILCISDKKISKSNILDIININLNLDNINLFY